MFKGWIIFLRGADGNGRQTNTENRISIFKINKISVVASVIKLIKLDVYFYVN